MNIRSSIKNRLIAIIMMVAFFTGAIAYGSFLFWFLENQYKTVLKESKTVALILSQDIAKLILLDDISGARDITTKLKSFSSLNKMVLYNLEGIPLLQYSEDNKSFKVEKLKEFSNKKSLVENELKLLLKSYYEHQHLGYVQLEFKVLSVMDIIKSDLIYLITILILMLIVSYLLASISAKKFTEPILSLVSFLEKLDFSKVVNSRVISREDNEFKTLYKEVNYMLDRLEKSYDELKIASVAFKSEAGITITDKHSNILRVNKAFTRITGFEQEEVIGKTPKILNSGTHNKEFYQNMYSSLKEYNIWMGEICNKHKNGNIVNEYLTIQTVLDDDGEVLYYVASFLDITFQKNIEKKLKEKEKLLIQQSKMAAMGEMLENIAHQWRQPLSLITSITTSLSLNKEVKTLFTDDEEKKHLNKISETVRYLSHTIDDFRNFFKQDKEKKEIELKKCYERAIKLVNDKFITYNIEVFEELEDIKVLVLENEYIQVLINLLNNAKDQLLTRKNQRRVIIVSIKKEEKEVVLSIKDNGGGIPEEIIDRVFEPYFTTKFESTGTGIGLYMSQEMITKNMNGQLLVENEEYQFENQVYRGAKFKIVLPII